MFIFFRNIAPWDLHVYRNRSDVRSGYKTWKLASFIATACVKGKRRYRKSWQTFTIFPAFFFYPPIFICFLSDNDATSDSVREISDDFISFFIFIFLIAVIFTEC